MVDRSVIGAVRSSGTDSMSSSDIKSLPMTPEATSRALEGQETIFEAAKKDNEEKVAKMVEQLEKGSTKTQASTSSSTTQAAATTTPSSSKRASSASPMRRPRREMEKQDEDKGKTQDLANQLQKIIEGLQGRLEDEKRERKALLEMIKEQREENKELHKTIADLINPKPPQEPPQEIHQREPTIKGGVIGARKVNMADGGSAGDDGKKFETRIPMSNPATPGNPSPAKLGGQAGCKKVQ